MRIGRVTTQRCHARYVGKSSLSVNKFTKLLTEMAIANALSAESREGVSQEAENRVELSA
jgi:hypothetical protein